MNFVILIMLFLLNSDLKENLKDSNFSDSTVELSIEFKEFNPNRRIFYDSSTSLISYFLDYTVYHLPEIYLRDSMGKKLPPKIEFAYFVCRNKSNVGYYFRNMKDTVGIEKKADSFLAPKIPIHRDLLSTINQNFTLKKQSKLNQKKELIFEKKDKNNSLYKEILKLEFSNKLNGLEFSLSKHFDSTYHSKLVKITYQKYEGIGTQKYLLAEIIYHMKKSDKIELNQLIELVNKTKYRSFAKSAN